MRPTCSLVRVKAADKRAGSYSKSVCYKPKNEGGGKRREILSSLAKQAGPGGIAGTYIREQKAQSKCNILPALFKRSID